MLLSKFSNIKIEGISVAAPSKRIPVETYNEAFGEETIIKFAEMTGVKSVCRAVPEQTASDLGYEAAKNLFDKKGVDTSEIGMLVFITQKPDYRTPSTAFVLHKRLGLPESCSCFDINLACSGFLFSLHTVYSMLKNSDAKKALLITADTSHKTLSPMDRTMIMLFGDSGSATLISKTEEESPAYFTMRTDGQRFKSIITPSGAYRNMGAPRERVEWTDGIMRSDYDTHMKGMDVFGFSIKDVPQLMKEFLEALGTTPADYDSFALHQANMYILNQISRKLKVPMDKIPVALDRYGNNSSNSVPLVLADHYAGKGDTMRVFMSGFGAGLSWACADVMIDTNAILPILETDAYYEEETTLKKEAAALQG